MNSSSRGLKPISASSALLFSMLSVNRSMLNTMSRFLVRAHARMFLRVFHVGREDRRRNAELEVLVRPGQLLHRRDRLAGLVEAPFHVPHLVVNVPDAVERDARAEEQPVLGAELDDPRELGDRTMRRQPGRVDADLAQPRQAAVEQLDHLRQVVPRGRLAARDVQVLDRAPEVVVHDAVELLEREVGLPVAVLPVVAHLAARVADERAVVDQHRRPDRVDARGDVSCWPGRVERLRPPWRDSGAGSFPWTLSGQELSGSLGDKPRPPNELLMVARVAVRVKPSERLRLRLTGAHCHDRRVDRAAPEGPLTALGVEEHVALHLARAIPQAEDVAGVAVAVGARRLLEETPWAARRARSVDVPRRSPEERHQLIVRHVRRVLVPLALQDCLRVAAAAARASGRSGRRRHDRRRAGVNERSDLGPGPGRRALVGVRPPIEHRPRRQVDRRPERGLAACLLTDDPRREGRDERRRWWRALCSTRPAPQGRTSRRWRRRSSGLSSGTVDAIDGDSSVALPRTTGVKIVKTIECENGPVLAPSCARARQ